MLAIHAVSPLDMRVSWRPVMCDGNEIKERTV